jgi:hypothetical protein
MGCPTVETPGGRLRRGKTASRGRAPIVREETPAGRLYIGEAAHTTGVPPIRGNLSGL